MFGPLSVENEALLKCNFTDRWLSKRSCLFSLFLTSINKRIILQPLNRSSVPKSLLMAT